MIGGLIKATAYYNRVEQRKEWKVIASTVEKYIGKEIAEPDWNKSVKQIDKYMEMICKENNIDFKHLQGRA